MDAVKVERARELRRGMTAAERTLWTYLRAHRFQGLHFRRQQLVGGFIVDFYCHSRSLAVEVDGPIHEGLADHDRERDRLLAEQGIHVIRFSNAQVEGDVEAVLAGIDRACVETERRRRTRSEGGACD